MKDIYIYGTKKFFCVNDYRAGRHNYATYRLLEKAGSQSRYEVTTSCAEWDDDRPVYDHEAVVPARKTREAIYLGDRFTAISPVSL